MFTKKIITEVGYIETTIPSNYFNKLLVNLSNNAPQEDFNNHLAGQIENEKKIDSNIIPIEIKNIISRGCYEYIRAFGHNRVSQEQQEQFDKGNYPLEHIDSWINYQKPGEYNPIHNHYGDLVYVMWIKIPYKIENERNFPSSKRSNFRGASCFEFTGFSNPFSRCYTLIFVDETYEGKIIIFHADMQHTVYPFFTSNEYRISISGNFKLVDEKHEKENRNMPNLAY